MKFFQILVLIIVAPLALVCLHAWIIRRQRRMAAAAFVFTSIAVTMAVPGLTQWAADLLGIGRGADLVGYVTALACMGGILLSIYSHRRLRLQITELTRRLALQQLDESVRQAATVTGENQTTR